MIGKLTRTIVRTFVFALTLCATTSAWAAYANGTSVSWKSRDSIATKSTVGGGGYAFTIKLPVSDDLPKFSRVKITQIKIGARENRAVSQCGAYIQINGVNSDTITAFDGKMYVDSSNTTSLDVCNYVFSSDLQLLVGVEYTIQPYNSSGVAMNSQTAAIQPLPNPQVISLSADRSYCCAYEVYGEVISTDVPTYKASPSGTNVSLSSLSWTLDDEAADLPSDLSTCGLEVTLNDGATLTIDSDISSIISFTLNGANASLAVSDSSYMPAATVWDFSGFTGNLTFNVDDDIDATISACLKTWMNSDLKWLTVKVSGDDSVDASWSGNTTFTTHTTFDGGTANLEVIQANDGIDLCNNSSNDNPLWRVKDNTTLNLIGKDLGGWSAAQKAKNCVMAVDGGGRLNLKDNKSNTFFYQGRFLLAPGATLDVQTTNNRLKLNGGRTKGYEQIYVPDQNTDMTATPAVVSGTGVVNANNNGFGIYVGENAQLDWSASIVRNGSAKIVKNGAGTLKIIGQNIGFPIDGNEGTIELSATKIENKISVAQEFSGKLRLVAPTTTDYWWGFTDLTGAQHLPNRPELELAMSTQFLRLDDMYNNGANPLTVKNLSGSATVTSSCGDSSAGNKIIDSLQTANTTFSGVFTGDANDASALTVHGADNASTIYGLTLSGVNDTRGPLTIENNAKVVFPSTGGSWASGTVTVGNGGYLEAQNTTALGAVTLQEGATIVIPTASSTVVPLTGTTVTLPTSGMVNVDLTGVSATDSEIVTIISATTLVNADASIFRQTDGNWRFSVDGNTIKATKLGTATWSNGSWSDSDFTGYATASIVASGTQDVTLPASATFDTLTITGSGTITLKPTSSETFTVSALSIGSEVTLNASSSLVLAEGCAITGDGVLNIPANTTLAMDGVTCSTKVTVAGTLETSGATTLSAANTSAAGSLIEVVNGVTTLSSLTCGLSGNITIQSDGELKFAESYNDSGVDIGWDYLGTSSSNTVKVYGKLNMPDRNLWLRANNTLELYQGAEVLGSGPYAGFGSLIWAGNASLMAYGDAEINASITTLTDCSPVFNVAENKTLTISTAFIGQSVKITSERMSGGSLTKAGAGTLDLTAITPTKPITINAGTVVASTNPANANFANMTINQNGTFTLKNVAWTGAPSRFSGSGTLELYSESASCNHTVTGVTFPGIVKLSNVNMHNVGSPNYQNNITPVSADMFAANIRPEFILDSDLTHLGNGYYNNNPEHPLRIKNLSGSGEFRGQWGSGEYKYVVETLQERNTTYDGTLGCDASGSSPRCVSLSVIGSTQSEIHSLTITQPINGNEDIGCQTSTLKVSDYSKVIFSENGGWGYGHVIVGDDGYLECTNNAAVKKLTLNDGATLVFPTSSSCLSEITSITFSSGTVTVSYPSGVTPTSGTKLINWSSAPAGSFVFDDGADVKQFGELYYLLQKDEDGLYIRKAVAADSPVSSKLYASIARALEEQDTVYLISPPNETVTLNVGKTIINMLSVDVSNLTVKAPTYEYVSPLAANANGNYSVANAVNAAATYYWIGAPDSAWSTVGNWAVDAADGPTATRAVTSIDSVVFNDGASVSCSAASVSCEGMTINGNVTLAGANAKDINLGGNITGSGVLTLVDACLKNSLAEAITVANTVEVRFTEDSEIAASQSVGITFNGPVSISGTIKAWDAVHTVAGTTTLSGNFNKAGGGYELTLGNVVVSASTTPTISAGTLAINGAITVSDGATFTIPASGLTVGNSASFVLSGRSSVLVDNGSGASGKVSTSMTDGARVVSTTAAGVTTYKVGYGTIFSVY